MKKRLGFIFLGILILLSVLYFLRYKRTLVFEDKLPKSVTEVIHINLRRIEHHILADVIRHPLKYLDFKLPEKKKDSAILKKTITIPRNLFFYTNELAFKNGWFSSLLKVKNKIKLEQYLIKEGFVQSIDDTITLFNKGNILLAIEDERLLVVYRKNKEAVTLAVLKTIFDEVHFLSDQTDLLKSIVNSKSDMSYATTTKDFLEANFKNGMLEILGRLHAGLFLSADHEVFSDRSTAYIATKINKEHRFFTSFITKNNSDKFNQLTKLSIDSIVDMWDGNIAINLKSIDKKIDTIVTYEYDDDFNKIEKNSVQVLLLPNVAILLGSQADMYAYFQNNRAVQIIENDTLFTSFPFYKMYARKRNNGLHVFTQKEFDTSSAKEEQFKLKAHLDIDSYLERPLVFSLNPIKNDYFQLLKNVSATITTDDEVSIQVRMKDNNRNFLGHFIKP